MGTLYWITGLAGAGKTAIANELYKILKAAKSNVVFLDGDNLRAILRANGAYSSEERLKLALWYCGLCKMLTEQGMDVVCATISMFKQCHLWNRKNIPKYREIYLRVPMNILIKRDVKKIYSRALKKEINQVVGIDIPFDEPETPDLIINNNGTKDQRSVARMIYKHFSKRKD